ncbi:MAG: dihydroxy-acid dehydratase, partial [Spirochaetes bacterium]|nr:dihydroxy-acid dehydratase [Spirochaetota bacterium]
MKAYIDPVIKQPEPVTLLLPVIEQTLKEYGLKPDRSQIARRILAGKPRITIVKGSSDHPAQVYDNRITPFLVRSLWKMDAIPFVTCVPAVCDGLAQGHEGMRFSLSSRNHTARLLFEHIAAHHYHGAIFITSCDKRPAADLASAIMVDRFYKNNFGRNFFALFLNAPVMKDRDLPMTLRKRFKDVIRILPENLTSSKLRCNVYAMYSRWIHQAIVQKKISSNRGQAFLYQLSLLICPTGGTCPFLGTGNTSKFVLYALGVVPDEMAFITPQDISKFQSPSLPGFIRAINRNDKKYCISDVVKRNFKNAIHVFSAVQGSLNWFLHFEFLSENLGLDFARDRILTICEKIPGVFHAESMYSFAMKKKEQKNFFRYLLKEKILKNCLTMAGMWKERLGGGDTRPSSFILKKSLEPCFLQFKGNCFQSLLIKVNPLEKEELKRFHNKLFIARVYRSQDECVKDLLNDNAILEYVLKKTPGPVLKKVEEWNKGEIRIAVFLLKQGVRAAGMPEMYYPSEYLNQHSFLRKNAILITDGRFSGATYG